MNGWREAAAALLREPWSEPDSAPDKTVITATTPPRAARNGGSVGFGGSVAGGNGTETAAARLARLGASPPPGVSPSAWAARLARAEAFERAWGPQARALGWSDAELYAMHPDAPLSRLDAMGAAFVGPGAAVVAVTAEAVVLSVPPRGLVQRARKPTLSVPPAWEVFGNVRVSLTISENLSGS